MTRKTNTAAANTAANTAAAVLTFTPKAVSLLGEAHEARYSITHDKHVYVFTQLFELPMRLHIAPDMPMYAAAYKAAKLAVKAGDAECGANLHDPTVPKGPCVDSARLVSSLRKAAAAPAKQEKPAAKPAEKAGKAPAKQEKPAAKPAAKAGKAPAKQEKPAAKPAAKAGKAPAKQEPVVRDGQIVGTGWRIVFDDATQRTRVICEQPSAAVLDAIQSAGFYRSAAMGSWNKRLTVKARKAAIELAQTLQALTK